MRRSVPVAAAVVLAFTLIVTPAQAAERLYISTEAQTAMFDGQAMWRIAARCAALEDNIEVRFAFQRQATEAYIRRYPDSTHLREKHDAERPRLLALSEGSRARFARFGALRAALDHPGEPGAATFEAEASRQLAEMRARPFAVIDEWTAVERACGEFMSQMVRRDILSRMLSRRPDLPGPNG